MNFTVCKLHITKPDQKKKNVTNIWPTRWFIKWLLKIWEISIAKINVCQIPFTCRCNYKEKVVSHRVGRYEEVTEVMMSEGSTGGQQMSSWRKSIKKGAMAPWFGGHAWSEYGHTNYFSYSFIHNLSIFSIFPLLDDTYYLSKALFVIVSLPPRGIG